MDHLPAFLLSSIIANFRVNEQHSWNFLFRLKRSDLGKIRLRLYEDNADFYLRICNSTVSARLLESRWCCRIGRIAEFPNNEGVLEDGRLLSRLHDSWSGYWDFGNSNLL